MVDGEKGGGNLNVGAILILLVPIARAVFGEFECSNYWRYAEHSSLKERELPFELSPITMISNRRSIDVNRRRSDVASPWWKVNHNPSEAISVAELPWGALKMVQTGPIDYGAPPAKFSAQSLILELFVLFERKLNHISIDEAVDKPISKTLRRGEDTYLENLLHALHAVCETCLPSVLSALIRWCVA